MSELEDLHGEFVRLGVLSHVHAGEPGQNCPCTEVCLREEEPFSTVVTAPEGRGEVHVDTMTAYGVLAGLPEDAGFDVAWRELLSIDRGP